MKKTFNINLAGIPFIIDEDAYNLLNDYLDTIRYAFNSNEDTEELADDIENRIAEILYETDPEGKRIVTIGQISKVIERIGQPEEIIDIDETISEKKLHGESENTTDPRTATPPPLDPASGFQQLNKKKLFRDPQNAMLGGVCSGLASYFNIDVSIIRLIAVLLLFLSVSTVAIVYIILWIVLPEASTPYQRMQMMGQNPTMENIGKTVTGNLYDQNFNNAAVNSRPEGLLSKCLSVFVKCLVIFGLIIGCPIMVALIIGFIGCLIAIFVLGATMVGIGGFSSFTQITPDSEMPVIFILLAVIGGLITLGIPLWLLIRMAFKNLRNKPYNISSKSRRPLLFIWLMGIALLTIFTIQAVRAFDIRNHINRENREKSQDFYIEENEEIDFEDIQNLEMSPDGIYIRTKEGQTISINNGGISINSINSSEKPTEILPADSINSSNIPAIQ